MQILTYFPALSNTASQCQSKQQIKMAHMLTGHQIHAELQIKRICFNSQPIWSFNLIGSCLCCPGKSWDTRFTKPISSAGYWLFQYWNYYGSQNLTNKRHWKSIWFFPSLFCLQIWIDAWFMSFRFLVWNILSSSSLVFVRKTIFCCKLAV